MTRVNREFTTLFGYSAEEACGRVLDELILPQALRQHSPPGIRVSTEHAAAAG